MTETCAEFADRWLESFPRYRDSTIASYTHKLKPFLEEFGGTPMDQIRRRQARTWANGHRSQLPPVRAMFNDAIDDEVIGSNPFAGLGLGAGHGRKQLKPISEGELLELARTSLKLHGRYGPEFRANILFAAYTGIRPSEMFVLEWGDIDLKESLVSVTKTRGVRGERTLPKNGRVRTIVLPRPAKEALLWAVGTAHPPDELVFKTPHGKELSRTSHLRYWDPVRKAADRPKMQFYELRHFCATHLLELGLSPSDVATQLGHTDGGALVMSTYGHPAEAAARTRVADAFA